MAGQKCRQCGRHDWEIYTDNTSYNFADGHLIRARCADCGNTVHANRKGMQ